jgi:putative endonuclease
MNHYVYILYSDSIRKYYVGYSSEPEQRLAFHNSPLNKIWSKRGQPWVLKRTFLFPDKTAALQAEKVIKRMKSKAFIEKIVMNGFDTKVG